VSGAPGGRGDAVPRSVCVVGAGLAGIACARVLTDAGRRVVVLERARTVGGRMASGAVAGRPVDSGAQYLTVSSEPFRAVVSSWAARGLARPWTDAFAAHEGGRLLPPKPGPLRWGTPLGLRSLVADLAKGLDVRLRTTVEGVAASVHGPTVDGAAYDAVLLAMPDPQALRLLGAGLAAERAEIAGRAWEPQLALLCGWSRRSWDVDAAFVNDSSVLGFVADDGSRRGDGAPVLVAHSTPGFAAGRLASPAAAAPAMTAALAGVLGLTAEPVWSHVRRWSFARPAASRAEPFFLGASRVGLCGDAWGNSKVETAWASGDALGRALLDAL